MKCIQDRTATLTAQLATRIVASYVASNQVSTGELSSLIHNIGDALERLRNGGSSPVRRPASPIDIRNSVTPDYLICLEDGLKFKSLRRHLSKLGLTPDEYRKRWELPADYPMVAPNYASKRSALAKQLGLGKRRT
ncbi:Transcriptional regulatory protein ros [Ensifer psoraleae]|uniref:MucR family transcriptional regulator n=1 Tax=Sinorhizobium psoraleae TaxID=520838 RepID=UPI001568F30B|nr:MucR family transcriptional regulator [Sinorhizobium psoraleae]NRP74528.1 Transcriptional regulatory protein ros [Sinorhizobium psoraleae]